MNQLHSQELERLASLTFFETRARQRGYKIVAGVDEAGRGPLAGPVVAAACILPENCILPGLDDSKKLNELERASLYKLIAENPEIVSAVAVVACGTIDEINVLQASLYAMSLAIQKLSVQPEFVLVDGPYVPKIGMPSEAIIDGDALSASIAAASIIAKWTRDQIMEEYHRIWPEYGFDKHKGYATQLHRQAIESYGLCPIHRKSFAPVREAFLA